MVRSKISDYLTSLRSDSNQGLIFRTKGGNLNVISVKVRNDFGSRQSNSAPTFMATFLLHSVCDTGSGKIFYLFSKAYKIALR